MKYKNREQILAELEVMRKASQSFDCALSEALETVLSRHKDYEPDCPACGEPGYCECVQA